MIESHQILLEKFYSAESTCISEFSSRINADTLNLIKEVREYADNWDLNSSFLDKDFAYFEVEDE